MPRIVAWALVGIAFGAGIVADRPPVVAPMVLGGYRVIAVDFHTHSSMWSNGALTPWGLVLEARRQRLDAFAITGHNEVLDAKIGRWFAGVVGGPVVLVGQEILAPDHHVIAVGIDRVVNSRLRVVDQVAEVHRQGGVAIAAHALRAFWPGFDDEAMASLDGSEVCHPAIYVDAVFQQELAAFRARGSLAPIGSSDFHGPGRMGICRTYVFAKENTASAIVDAVHQRRTVVYGLAGEAYGDPELVALAGTRPELKRDASPDARASLLDWVSRLTGLAGLVGVVFLRKGS